MLITWTIRYLDRADKQFKNRSLHLDTDTLDPAIKMAIEFVIEASTGKSEREILRFRKHFTEERSASFAEKSQRNGVHGFALIEYFEDDEGNEISLDAAARIVTGNPNIRIIPSGSKQHDIDYMLSTSKPVPVADITLSMEQLKLLAYFVRDFRELAKSAFMADRPATLQTVGSTSTLTTAASDEEIRSFLTIFRRLYMAGEPANFIKAVGVFSDALGDHPLGKWVKGVGHEYELAMADSKLFPFGNQGQTTFTAKNLIDVLIYTRYAHQPLGKNEQRQQEYDDYLRQLNGNKAKLDWMCLTEVWKSALTIGNVGRIIASWFDRYCQSHQSSADVLASLQDDHPGIGSQEKQADRSARIFREKTEALADAIWKQHGSPAGGSAQFFAEAEKQLKKQLEDGGDGGNK
jgi:hypothetical protein